MQTVLIVIHLMVVLALIGVVLIQRSEGGGLGIGGGGGSSGGFFSARGSANVLTRATAILAAIFFVTSLSLTVIAGWGRTPPSILNQPGLPTGPSVPQSGATILDQIRPPAPAGQSAPADGSVPAAPAAPAPGGPQVPQSQ